MKRKLYSRKMSYNERLFIAADEICSPVLTQFFFEGEGSLDAEMLRRAVEVASSCNPGSRLILKGHLGWSRWVDSGQCPPVIEIDGSGWDGKGPDGAPFLQKKLDPRSGPTCEVLLIYGNPLRICFRTHHGVMDGRGTLTWAEDIFRVLRGQEPIGTSSRITDLELARQNQDSYRVPFPRDCIAPTGLPGRQERGVTWKRISIPGRYRNVLGQIALLSAREAWKHQDGPVRFAIPADLRSRDKDLRSTGNLSIAIYIEVGKNSTPEEISMDIKRQLERKHDCLVDRFDPFICYLPMRLLVNKGHSMIRAITDSGKYGTSGILSNMGKIPMNVFSGGGFTARAFWGIPPSLETVPFFMGITYRDDVLEIMLTTPRVLADNQRIDTVLKNISDGLVED